LEGLVLQSASLEAIKMLADLGMMGAVLIGGGGVWWVLRRNGKTNGEVGKLLDVMKGREQRIDRMLDELAGQGRHLEQMVAEEQRTARAMENLVDRIDRFMFGKFGRLDQ